MKKEMLLLILLVTGTCDASERRLGILTRAQLRAQEQQERTQIRPVYMWQEKQKHKEEIAAGICLIASIFPIIKTYQYITSVSAWFADHAICTEEMVMTLTQSYNAPLPTTLQYCGMCCCFSSYALAVIGGFAACSSLCRSGRSCCTAGCLESAKIIADCCTECCTQCTQDCCRLLRSR